MKDNSKLIHELRKVVGRKYVNGKAHKADPESRASMIHAI